MATSRISASLLAGALPGIRQGAQAAGMGGQAFGMGFEQSAELQSKLAQALATTNLNRAKTAEVQQQLDAQRPEAIRNNTMIANGVPLDAAPEVDQFLAKGKLGSQYDALPADQAGPVLPAPDWASKLGPLARELGITRSAIAIGDKSVENIAKASQIARSTGLSDAILAGRQDPTKVAQAEYAAKGSAPFHFAEYGVGNNLTGSVDDATGPAQLFAKNRQAEIGARDAQAGASKASAANSYASAGQHAAQTQKIRQDIDMGSKGVLQQTDQGLLLVDPRTGQSRPVVGVDGKTPGKPTQAAKPLPASAAKGYLDNQSALRNVDTALQLIKGGSVNGLQGDAAATGAKGYLPDALLSRMDPAGVSTRAIIADIGSLKIHDRSGAAVTASETPRLKPFVPSATDSAETVVKKLELFRQNYAAMVEDAEQFYRDSGYVVPELKSAPQPVRAQVRTAAPVVNVAPAAPAGGFTYLGKE